MIHGYDEIIQQKEKTVFDFSSILLPFSGMDELKAHLVEHIGVIEQYPETEPLSLERELAEYLHVPEGSVLVTNGVAEAIFLVAQLYRGARSIIPQPTSTIYAQACATHGHEVNYSDNDGIVSTSENRVYWLCNPSLPTGNVLPKGFVSYMVRHNPDYVFVIDQSYEAFTNKPLLKPNELLDCHNVITLHSASRKYGIPGLRMGYLTASPVIIDQLRMLRQPWAISPISVEASRFLLRRGIHLATPITERLEEARRLEQRLNLLPGVRVLDSASIFMLVHVEKYTAKEVASWLMEHYGLLVRDASHHHGLGYHHFRIMALTPEADDLLVDALSEMLEL